MSAEEAPPLLARWRAARRHHVKRVARRASRRLKRFFGRQSLVGDPAVFAPGLFPWMAALQTDWKRVRAELDGLLETRDRLPALSEISPDARGIATDDWKVFLFYGFGARSERNCAKCPETARLLDAVPGIQNSWFSILGPQVDVPKHRGVSKGLLRCHLGLRVPRDRENCWIRIAGQSFPWQEGGLLVFDDTVLHRVGNATDEERAVLLIDFVRPMRWAGRLVNRIYMEGIRRHGYFRDGYRNQLAWEDRYYAAAQN